jgi:hypothetical protein
MANLIFILAALRMPPTTLIYRNDAMFGMKVRVKTRPEVPRLDLRRSIDL